MNMQEIERALRELRLSGIAATLSTRVMQAQSTQEPFLDIIEDGGGVVRSGKRIIKLPPGPLLRDLLALLVVDDAAQSMSEKSQGNSRALRRAVHPSRWCASHRRSGSPAR